MSYVYVSGIPEGFRILEPTEYILRAVEQGRRPDAGYRENWIGLTSACNSAIMYFDAHQVVVVEDYASGCGACNTGDTAKATRTAVVE